MLSWLGLLLVIGIIYGVVVLVRGIGELVAWFQDQVPSRRAHRPQAATKGNTARGASASPPHDASPRAHRPSGERLEFGEWLAGLTARLLLLHWLATAAEFVRGMLRQRDFAYWFGRALAEENVQKRIAYATKAVTLNPGYTPGWGLKANALLALSRYAEAKTCFEKILETSPTPISWYGKGRCCLHLGQSAEAVHCFDQALATAPENDREFRQEMQRHKQQAENQLARPGNP